MTLEEKIFIYPQLSEEEQREVDRYVERHPELAPLLDEVKVAGVFDSDRLRETTPPNREALAYYVATRHFSARALPPALQPLFERIEQRLAADPEWRAQYEAFVRRLEAAADRSDPAAQFEALSGHTLESQEVPADRSSRHDPHPRGTRRARWAAVAVLVCLGLYGMLWVADGLMQSDMERLAAVESSELQLEGYTTTMRGGRQLPDTASSDALHLEALAHMRKARTSFLGLFRRYDPPAIREAASLFERVIEREEEHSYLQLEAYYFLGKIRLAQGRREEALTAFGQVVEGGGRNADEAREIVRELAGTG